MMGKLQEPRNRKTRRPSYRYRCSMCMYRSSRRYNILRHEFRIHSASSRPRECCDLLFETKGEYYVHCEENHPNSRPTNRTSRYKYKILPATMISKSSSTSIVTSSPETSHEIRYMLRSRVRPKTHSDNEKEITLLESVSPKSSESPNESELDAPMERSAILQQSSGYATKTSCSTTFDSTEEKNKINILYSEELNQLENLNHHKVLEDTTEKVPEESNELSPMTFSKNVQITAGFGEDSKLGLQETFNESNVTISEHQNNEKHVNIEESSDLSNMSVHPKKSIDSKESDILEDMKTSNEDEWKKNYCTFFTATPHNLPPKKRILLSLGFSSRENIARKPIDDRLYLPKQLKVEETPLRKKYRLSKKMKCRKLRNGINLAKYSSTFSDTENVPPTTANPRKQKVPGLKVDLRADGSLTWDEITRLMREHVRSVDFDSFKVNPR